MPVSTKRYGQQYYYYGKSDVSRNKNKSLMDLRKNSSANRQIERMETLRRQNMANSKKREINQNSVPVRPKSQQVNTAERPIKREENSGPMSIDKTNDILKQINDYLDKEKKDLT